MYQTLADLKSLLRRFPSTEIFRMDHSFHSRWLSCFIIVHSFRLSMRLHFYTDSRPCNAYIILFLNNSTNTVLVSSSPLREERKRRSSSSCWCFPNPQRYLTNKFTLRNGFVYFRHPIWEQNHIDSPPCAPSVDIGIRYLPLVYFFGWNTKAVPLPLTCASYIRQSVAPTLFHVGFVEDDYLVREGTNVDHDGIATSM